MHNILKVKLTIDCTVKFDSKGRAEYIAAT